MDFYNVVRHPDRLHLSNARGPRHLDPDKTKRGATVLTLKEIIAIATTITLDDLIGAVALFIALFIGLFWVGVLL